MHQPQRGRLLYCLTKRQRAIAEAQSQPLSYHTSRRWYAASIDVAQRKEEESKSLLVSAKARYSEIGVQHLSDRVHSQIFPGLHPETPAELVELSKEHLAQHELLGKSQDGSSPVAFEVPNLHGQTLDEHFFKLGKDAAEPYLTIAKKYALANLPPRPRKWVRRSGWTKYNSDGTAEEVDAPQEELLTFDTEVMWKETSFACMACAASPTAWYAWLSPWLLGESKNDRHLIPMGDPTVPRIIVGHNVGYDRARIAEEYSLEQSKNFFMDTMSLHVATNGMCSRQRPTWMKHNKDRALRDDIANSEAADLARLIESSRMADEEEELWVGRSSINSLRDVAKFHCGITIDKAQREYFGELDRDGIMAQLDELLDYCAADVDVTHRVYRKVFPAFLETCPHPVSFAALRHMATEILPTNKGWEVYIANAEATYQKLSLAVTERLEKLAETALEQKAKPESYENDPWLGQLDWSGQEIKMLKAKKGQEPKPKANQKQPGMPQWYKDLFATSKSSINLTVRTRISPILLRLAWDGYPLTWSDIHGFTYRVPIANASKFRDQGLTPADMAEETNLRLRDGTSHLYFKLPHKDGPQARCTSPLAKGYLQYFESGKLTSEYAYAKAALEMNASCSYWISARDRISNQMLVYADEASPRTDETARRRAKTSLAFILPQVIPMGTITRRAVENTWLTAANAKKNRVGSELKSMIAAPPGYAFVGADVDSEELWIASLVGDAQFKLHGGNAVGFMTLEGTKSAGTDLHSRTAKILSISRNDAKIFNYGRIYGAGQKFATQLLRQFNPLVAEKQATETAAQLYAETKGRRTTRKSIRESSFWRGGTESLVFNRLEDFAEQPYPRTPVLAAGITEALMRRYLSKGGFLPSRINWAIQSSGVDYLHLLIVSMEYLSRRYNLDARLSLTVHDEIRYLVKEEDKYRCAMALQVANLWTRAMFAQQLGINDLPQSCAFFSAVDIDHVLRKEVDMTCVTPSHATVIPPGESLDILQLLDMGEKARLDPAIVPVDPPSPEKWEYVPRTPVIKDLEAMDDIFYLRAQISRDDATLKDIIREKQLHQQSQTSTPFTIPTSEPSTASKTARKTATRQTKPRSPRTSSPTANAKVPRSKATLPKTSNAAIVTPPRSPASSGVLVEVEDLWKKEGYPFLGRDWEKTKSINGWSGYGVPSGGTQGKVGA